MRHNRLIALNGVVLLVLIGRGAETSAQGRIDPPAAPVSPWTAQAPPNHFPPLPAPAAPQSPPRPVVPALAQMPPQAPNNVQNANYQSPVGSPSPADGPVLPVSASAPPQQLPNLMSATPASYPVAPTAAMTRPSALPSQQPAVLVEKRGPETVMVGQPISYEIVVRNIGPVPVFHVRVEDELPAGVRYLGGDPQPEMGGDHMSWTLGVLEPNAERKLRVDVMPTGEGEQRSSATVSFAVAAGLRTQVVRPQLNLAMTGPEQAQFGEPVAFQITVSNPGSGPVKGLVLRDKLPAGLRHQQGSVVEAELGTLGPGETRSVTLRTSATLGGAQLNEITASAEGGLETSARATVNILEASLHVKRSGPAKCHVRSELTCEVEVANPGSAPAVGVAVTDTLPSGLDFLSATDGGQYDPTARALRWQLGTLAAGGKRTLTYRVKATAVGEQADKVVALAEHGLEAKAEAAVTVEGVAALMLEVIDIEGPSEVGADMTYEVRVVNRGTVPCTNVQLQATVPDGLQPRDATGPAAYHVSGQQMTFDALPRLASKADAVFRVRVKAMQPGDYRFRAQVSCDQIRSAMYKEEFSHVYKD